jgi:hypothetical protein
MNYELLKETIFLLECLKQDADMALVGLWDCTTREGIEDGFSAQVELIEEMLIKLKESL